MEKSCKVVTHASFGDVELQPPLDTKRRGALRTRLHARHMPRTPCITAVLPRVAHMTVKYPPWLEGGAYGASCGSEPTSAHSPLGQLSVVGLERRRSRTCNSTSQVIRKSGSLLHTAKTGVSVSQATSTSFQCVGAPSQR